MPSLAHGSRPHLPADAPSLNISLTWSVPLTCLFDETSLIAPCQKVERFRECRLTLKSSATLLKGFKLKRIFILTATLFLAAVILVACSGDPEPTETPSPTALPSIPPTSQPTSTPVPVPTEFPTSTPDPTAEPWPRSRHLGVPVRSMCPRWHLGQCRSGHVVRHPCRRAD